MAELPPVPGGLSYELTEWLRLLRRQSDVTSDGWKTGDYKVSQNPVQSDLWLLCNGQAVAKAQYPDLYEVVGGIYGETGLYFTLPDLTGRGFVGEGGGVDAGEHVGSDAVTLTTDNMPTDWRKASNTTHTHTLTDPGHDHDLTDPGHDHDITDPGHEHDSGTSETRTTDITIDTNTTGATVDSAETGLTIDSATTALAGDAGGGQAITIQPPALAAYVYIRT